MKIEMKKLLFVLGLVSAATAAVAADATEAGFGTPFTSHAVLQRDCKLPVWGSATPGSTVSVTLGGKTLSAKADDKGKWKVEFPPMKAGVGHTLRLASGQRVFADLEDIAIGEVWICSGQSNMAMNWYGGLTRGKEEMEQNSYENLRVFHMFEAFSFNPLDRYERPTVWQRANINTVRDFSACGYFFGVELMKALKDVPVGLVNASWGGAFARVWMSFEAYAGADATCAREAKEFTAARKTYLDAGGAATFADRMAKWEKNCVEQGAIHAEAPDFDDSGWTKVGTPGPLPAGFDGCAWYRKEMMLTEEQIRGNSSKVAFGILNDKDDTYLNGVRIGGYAETSHRMYMIPDGLLKPGRNVFAIRLVDYGDDGGFTLPEALKCGLMLPGSTISIAEDWRMKLFPFEAKPVNMDQIQPWSPAVCYNAMIHPLFPMAIRGALWYQGCSDAGDPGRYAAQIRALVKDWRAHFTSPDELSFYLVQLPGFLETHADPIECNWAEMRWNQMKLGETLGKSGTAVIIEAGDHKDIHPKDKKTPGERLARLALVRTYGRKDLVEGGPIPVSAKVVKGGGANAVEVAFKDAKGLKTSDGGKVKGFQLAGADGKFAWAEAKAVKDKVAIAVPNGLKPAKVRYAWDFFPDCNLVNGEGLPCGSFELEVK